MGKPEEPGQEFTLTLTREGSACDGQYGEAEFALFSIAVSTNEGICDLPPVLASNGKLVSPCELVVEFDYPERVYADQSYPLTVHVETSEGEPVEGAELNIFALDGTGQVEDFSGTTDASGNFVTGAIIHSYRNEITLRVTAVLGGASGEGTASALRHNQILITSRISSGNASVGFWYMPTDTGITVYSDGDGEHGISNHDPITMAWSAQGSGGALGMSSSGDVSVTHESQLVLVGEEFVSCTHHGEVTGFGKLMNPDLDITTYSSSAEGRSRFDVGVAVWGDPATFNLSFSQGDQSVAALYGPNDFAICFQGDGPCPVDDDDKRGDTISTWKGGASGVLLPGSYTFVSQIVAEARFHPGPDHPNSGSENLSEIGDASFSVSH